MKDSYFARTNKFMTANIFLDSDSSKVQLYQITYKLSEMLFLRQPKIITKEQYRYEQFQYSKFHSLLDKDLESERVENSNELCLSTLDNQEYQQKRKSLTKNVAINQIFVNKKS